MEIESIEPIICKVCNTKNEFEDLIKCPCGNCLLCPNCHAEIKKSELIIIE